MYISDFTWEMKNYRHMEPIWLPDNEWLDPLGKHVNILFAANPIPPILCLTLGQAWVSTHTVSVFFIFIVVEQKGNCF